MLPQRSKLRSAIVVDLVDPNTVHQRSNNTEEEKKSHKCRHSESEKDAEKSTDRRHRSKHRKHKHKSHKKHKHKDSSREKQRDRKTSEAVDASEANKEKETIDVNNAALNGKSAKAEDGKQGEGLNDRIRDKDTQIAIIEKMKHLSDPKDLDDLELLIRERAILMSQLISTEKNKTPKVAEPIDEILSIAELKQRKRELLEKQEKVAENKNVGATKPEIGKYTEICVAFPCKL